MPEQRDRAPHLPPQVDPEQVVQDEVGEEPARRGRPRHEAVVAQHRQVGGRHAGTRADGLRDVGVERAGVDDVPAHLRVADREQQQRDDGQDERAGDPAAVADGDADRHDDDRRRERRHRGEDEEDDPGDAERVARQAACWLVGHRRSAPPQGSTRRCDDYPDG